MRYALLVWGCFHFSSLFAQSDTSDVKCKKCLFGLGFTYGMPFDQTAPPQPYGLHHYTDQRRFYISSEFELGYQLSEQIQIVINYSSSTFKFNQENFDDKMQGEFNKFHYYNDELFNAYSPIGSDFRTQNYKGHILILKLAHSFKVGNFTLFPTLGLGVEHWKHTDYSFILRELNSNAFTTYKIYSFSEPNMVFEPSVSLSFKEKPFFLELGLSQSTSKLRYEVASTRSIGTISSKESFQFNKKMTGIYVSLVVRDWFDEK